MSKVYTLSITCVAGRYLSEKYGVVCEVPADFTLDRLASLILHVVGFDGDHLSEFYVANSLRGKRVELGDSDDDDTATLRLCDIFPLAPRKKLYYTYDFGASWRFEIVPKGKLASAQDGLQYPRPVSQEGAKPREYGPDDNDDCW